MKNTFPSIQLYYIHNIQIVLIQLTMQIHKLKLAIFIMYSKNPHSKFLVSFLQVLKLNLNMPHLVTPLLTKSLVRNLSACSQFIPFERNWAAWFEKLVSWEQVFTVWSPKATTLQLQISAAAFTVIPGTSLVKWRIQNVQYRWMV